MELFKYTKYHPDFFNNFLVRYTPLKELNDPFEGKIQTSTIFSLMVKPFGGKAVAKILDESGQITEIAPEMMSRMVADAIAHTDKDLRAFCLSSSKHSLLMWSHYADSHKGIIVGFDAKHEYFNQNIEDSRGPGFLGRLHRVVYDRVRLEFEDVHKSYVHKSDEWMYEKEYRMFLLKEHRTTSVGNAQCEIDLYKIPEEAVTRIIIGARADKDSIVRDYELGLSKNEKLRHVKLEYAVPHIDLFHLDHHPL